jgi:TRAP-type C4-dicarboxylate transport system permease small subunit
MSAEIDLTRPTDGHRQRGLAVEEAIAAVAMAALGLITLANVVVRYLTNYSFAFTEEYSIALMVVVALLGGSIAAARNHHMRITWFVDNMPRRLAALSNTVAMLATVVMFGLLIALGGKLVWDEYRFEVTSPGLGEPQWIYTATLPLFSILVVIRAVAWWNTQRKTSEPTPETAPPPGAEI